MGSLPRDTEHGDLSAAPQSRGELNPSVVQHNALIHSAYRMTLNERRLLLICTSMLDSRKPARSRTLTITVDYVAFICGMSRREAWSTMERGMVSLWERTFTVERRRADGVTDWVLKRWCDERSREIRHDAIEIRLHEDVVKFLTMLSGSYTSYQLRQVMELRSFHAMRLYELCASVVSRKHRVLKLSVEEFRRILVLEEKYPATRELVRAVVRPAVREINETCDISVELRQIKDGRKVATFAFYVERRRVENKMGASVAATVPPDEPTATLCPGPDGGQLSLPGCSV